MLLFLCPSSSSHMWKPFQKLRYITLKVLTCLTCFYCRCRTSSVFVSIYLSGAITDFHRLYVHVSVANYHYIKYLTPRLVNENGKKIFASEWLKIPTKSVNNKLVHFHNFTNIQLSLIDILNTYSADDKNPVSNFRIDKVDNTVVF